MRDKYLLYRGFVIPTTVIQSSFRHLLKPSTKGETKMTEQTEKKKPALNIFVKVPTSDGDTRIGAQIGVAWKHGGEGEGYNIILDALPIPLDGKVELIAFAPKS